MLQLFNINKKYETGGMTQAALNNLNLCLRDNEFVAILGPSGSGKTTMLNIIGGLDRYDSGDLVINGVSTKNYGDREWDSYRNHTIGFVFQSYNLIPHQTILSNVELALTISGISRTERRKRAKEALENVGLGAHINKKPNQLSGGQMQRVAIARALVNNPDILLADEPTGALDSDTSIQVMELLKQVAKDRLVVMVTHNPELAEEYANRIVKLRDGVIVEDSNPFCITQEDLRGVKKNNTGKASMSFLTALSLSFNNLKTKIGRTLLTAFAGSIGIIGIALILSLSSGVTNYIDSIQKQMMTSYPITISSQSMDSSVQQAAMGEMAMAMSEYAQQTEYDGVYAEYMELEAMSMMSSVIVENNLTDFKKYLDNPASPIHSYLGENGIVYSYDVNFDIYSYDADGRPVNSSADAQLVSAGNSMTDMFGFDFTELPMYDMFMSSFMGGASSGAQNFSQLMPGKDSPVSSTVKKNYELVHGSWPDSYDEVVLVLGMNNSIPVTALYQLGIITAEQYNEISGQISDGQSPEKLKWDYEQLCNRSFYLVPASDRYKAQPNGTYAYIGDGNTLELEALLDGAVELKISGIIRPSEDATNLTIMTSVAYTGLLTDYLINYANGSEVVKAQQATPEINILTGSEFVADTDEEKAQRAKEYLSSLSEEEKKAMYSIVMMLAASKDETEQQTQPEQEENGFLNGLLEMLLGLFGVENADELLSTINSIFTMTGGDLDSWLEEGADTETLVYFYDEYVGGYSYEANMTAFGQADYERPESISIYTDSFENKDAVAACIESYNSTAGEDSKLVYSDAIAMITDSVTSIVNVVSYVLIAFVAVSLVVSSIMIGIITYISVLERTKEIGILRSIGASKRNISQVFNAETLIIGLCSGAMGILITELLIIPANAIIHALTGNSDVSAVLPIGAAVILIVLSVILTLVGGLIPSGKASKKDPVTALRSE